MAIDKKYVDQILKVSEKAALASSYLVGKKDKIAADQAAVDSMRFELNKIDMNGEVVIGEGSLDAHLSSQCRSSRRLVVCVLPLGRSSNPYPYRECRHD